MWRNADVLRVQDSFCKRLVVIFEHMLQNDLDVLQAAERSANLVQDSRSADDTAVMERQVEDGVVCKEVGEFLFGAALEGAAIGADGLPWCIGLRHVGFSIVRCGA